MKNVDWQEYEREPEDLTDAQLNLVRSELIKEMKEKEKENEKKYYVNNEYFYRMLRLYKKTRNRELLNELGKIFLLIAQRIITRPNFINYDNNRKGEMVSDATFFMVKYLDTYNITKKNPFAWFSKIAFNAFKQNINKYKKRDSVFIPLDYVENMDKGNESNNYD